MKKLLFALLAVMMGLSVYAQNDSLREAYSRIEILEQTITDQNSKIEQISKKVNEVHSINESLKKSLSIRQNPKSKIKLHDGVEYRIVGDVVGNIDTKEVQFTIEAENIGNDDKKLYYWSTEVIDNKGDTYNTNDRVIMKVNGELGNLISSSLNHHPNIPYTINVKIKGFNPEAQYIRYFRIDAVDGSRHNNDTAFLDIPIKWMSEE